MKGQKNLSISNGKRTEWSPTQSVIIPVNKIGRPRSGSPICLMKTLTKFVVHIYKALFFLALLRNRCYSAVTSFYEKSNSGQAIKPKKSVKRQTDTKTQWNSLQVSLFYSFHLRKSKVKRYLAFSDLSNMFLIQSLLYFQGSPVTRHNVSFDFLSLALNLCRPFSR